MTTETQKLRALSVSKISLAMQCPLKFKYRYIDRIPEESAGVMLAGRVVHSVLEKAENMVLAGEPWPSASDMDDWFALLWKKEFDEEQEKKNFVCFKWNDWDPEEAVKNGSRKLVRLARDEVLPKLHPKLVEHKINFDLDLNGSGPFHISGVVDLVEESELMSDWKTVQKLGDNQLKLDLQFMGYSIWHKEHFGVEETPCQKLFLVRQKTRVKFEVKKYTITEVHRNWFKECAAETWKMVQNGGFVPNTSSWTCKPEWCSFWVGCQGDLQ